VKPHEPAAESAISDGQPAPPVANLADSTGLDGVARLLRKRVKKFVALVPVVLAGGDPEAVHDARVASRRLQQAVSAFFPKPRTGKVRQLRRTPRRVRRALGEWRNCDVLLDLVERRQRRVRGEAKRRAWELVRAYLLEKRTTEIARARKKLLRQGPGDYADLAHRLVENRPADGADTLMQRLHASVEDAWAKWQSALARAQDTRAVADLHALRIATKELRYRTELLDDLAPGSMTPQLTWLADLQEALGTWHDRQLLRQAVAEAIGRADILLSELPAARVLLAELDAERRRPPTDVERIVRIAREHPGYGQMERWSATHSSLALTLTPPGAVGDGDETRKGEVNA
jgi:CHAD domain-containing protein